jgi:hypothetical protein
LACLPDSDTCSAGRDADIDEAARSACCQKSPAYHRATSSNRPDSVPAMQRRSGRHRVLELAAVSAPSAIRDQQRLHTSPLSAAQSGQPSGTRKARISGHAVARFLRIDYT